MTYDFSKFEQRLIEAINRNESVLRFLREKEEAKDNQKTDTSSEETGAAADAKKLGLTSMGFGNWGKNDKVTHRTVDDKLVAVADTEKAGEKKAEPKKAEKPEKEKGAKKNKPDNKDTKKAAKKAAEKEADNAEKAKEINPEADRVRKLMPGMTHISRPLSSVPRPQLQQVATKIADLAAEVEKAKAAGKDAADFDLCQVSIPGTNLYCGGNKGIDRVDMPQFKGVPKPGSQADSLPKNDDGEVDTEAMFREMLDRDGIKVADPEPVPPETLKATQRNMQGTKVAGMAQALEKDPNHPGITAPIYVSRDGYVLDGHHRWAAIIAYNAAHPDNPIPMQVRVIDEDIVPLVKRSNEFADEMGIQRKTAPGKKDEPEKKPDKDEKPPLGEPQGEYKRDPELEPKKDESGNVPGTDIAVENEENPDPEFTHQMATKMDEFYEDVLKEEGRAQQQVIEEMKREGKLPQDFAPVEPRDMGFGFKHPALKDNPELQSELARRIKEANKPPHWDLCKVSIPGTNKFCDKNIGIPRDEMPQLGGKPKPGSEGEKIAKKKADQKVRKKMGLSAEGDVPADRQKEYDELFAKENTSHVNVEQEFEDYLEEQGIAVSKPIAVPASSLKATQNQLVGEQVVGMVGALEEDPNNPFITAPIMVTRDGYVIDGHHRWAAIQAYNMKHCKPNGDKPCIEMKVRVVDENIDTHISRALAFADRMGIERMSGKGASAEEPKKEPNASKDATSEPPKEEPAEKKQAEAPKGLGRKVLDRVKSWGKAARAEAKEFFRKEVHKGNSPERRTMAEAVRDKLKGAWADIKRGARHEAATFRDAVRGVRSFVRGKKPNARERAALVSVGTKLIVTALVAAGLGGAAHGAVTFGQHVLAEFIPHVVGETVVKGIGRAALFAGPEDTTDDAMMEKFMEAILKNFEEMDIPNEILEKAMMSYKGEK